MNASTIPAWIRADVLRRARKAPTPQHVADMISRRLVSSHLDRSRLALDDVKALLVEAVRVSRRTAGAPLNGMPDVPRRPFAPDMRWTWPVAVRR